MVHKNPYGHDQQEDSTGTPENVADDSTSSGDEAYEVNTPPPKKRRVAQKKVVTVSIGEGDGSRSKGEVYPPHDSWSWRKYGQKPIKGSPYPRGYYRCSSSKGCPARKHVEKSCLDPTNLLITYSCEHNHPIPTTKHHSHHPTTSTTNSPLSISTDTIPVKTASEEFGVFANQPDMDSDNSSSFNELAGEWGWFADVGSTLVECHGLMDPTWVDADVAFTLPIGKEDQSLFGDLGELPECSVVFRRRGVEVTPCCAGTG